MLNDIGSGGFPVTGKEEIQDVLVLDTTDTQEKPERVVQGVSTSLVVEGGILLAGCAVTLGVASSAAASAAVTGAFSKLLGIIKHFLGRL